MNNTLVTEKQIKNFLEKVEKSFPIPISEKQNIAEYSKKLLDRATLCCEVEDGEIISMVAGYADNLVDGIAYISLVATVNKAQGRGYAKKLILDFINICVDKNMDFVHLYTHITNEKAIAMYKSIGFEEYQKDERPGDVHLIYRLN